MELGGDPQKIDKYIHGNLYFIYIVLQGIGFLSYIRIYIIYIIPFGK